MRTVRLVVEYEGTAYAGWQRQPNAMTIQQALEEAIEGITGSRPTVIGSGRTDAGVHALAQVASFRTESALAPERLRDALNATLPRDIVVKEAADAPEGFHAQRDARSKRYEYTIWNRRVRRVFDRDLCWRVGRPLDVEAMARAAEALVGTLDFKAFQASGSAVAHSVRTVTKAEWTRRGDFLVFGIEGHGFLYNMVRIIVGALVDVGLGRMSEEEFRDVIASRDRTRAGRTAPAKGLCLVEVRY